MPTSASSSSVTFSAMASMACSDTTGPLGTSSTARLTSEEYATTAPRYQSEEPSHVAKRAGELAPGERLCHRQHRPADAQEFADRGHVCVLRLCHGAHHAHVCAYHNVLRPSVARWCEPVSRVSVASRSRAASDEPS